MMNAGNYRFKLTWSSLWHTLQGGTRFVFAQGITILRLILLLDVSKWQGSISYIMMRNAGGRGVIIKCGQGKAKDLRFDENRIKARQAGIPRGYYWFYDSRIDPKAQAANFWNWTKVDRPELMHFVDYEENYGGPWKGWRNLKIFIQEFMRLSSLPASKIGIYTGYYYWIAHSPTTSAELSWFGKFDLWLAWYTNDPAKVLIPKPWTRLLLWQFGTPAEGAKFGTESIEIDQNWFNGDEYAFQTRFGIEETVPPVEPEPPDPRPEITPEPETWIGEVMTLSNLRVRTYPLAAEDTLTGEYVKQGEKLAGRIWEGNEHLWLHIDSSARAQLVGKWVAVRTSNGLFKYIHLSVPGTPTTPPVSPKLFPIADYTAWQNEILTSHVEMYRVRKWGDPLLGRSVADIGVANFQAVGLYQKSNNTMGGVSNYLRIPKEDINYLASLQVEDAYLEKKQDWRSQKMRWLCKRSGTIYFFMHTAKEGTWQTLPLAEWGTIALGGNLVSVESVETMTVKMPQGFRRTLPMARLRGFRKSDQGRPLGELLAAGLVHRCTCSYLPNDKYGDSPKGIVYSPLWSPRDWIFIGPKQPQPDAFYIPMEWLTK